MKIISNSGYGKDLLIDVYSQYETFTTEKPKDGITTIAKMNKDKMKELRSIVASPRFGKQFHEFTKGIFEGMDWSNLVVAGFL